MILTFLFFFKILLVLENRIKIDTSNEHCSTRIMSFKQRISSIIYLCFYCMSIHNSMSIYLLVCPFLIFLSICLCIRSATNKIMLTNHMAESEVAVAPKFKTRRISAHGTQEAHKAQGVQGTRGAHGDQGVHRSQGARAP
jgi:hypothetical protein